MPRLALPLDLILLDGEACGGQRERAFHRPSFFSCPVSFLGLCLWLCRRMKDEGGGESAGRDRASPCCRQRILGGHLDGGDAAPAWDGMRHVLGRGGGNDVSTGTLLILRLAISGGLLGEAAVMAARDAVDGSASGLLNWFFVLALGQDAWY